MATTATGARLRTVAVAPVACGAVAFGPVAWATAAAPAMPVNPAANATAATREISKHAASYGARRLSEPPT